MMKRVLHIGPHKTGSSFLQKHLFPNLRGVNYYGDGSIAKYYKINSETKPCNVSLWSTEAALGWPYPATEPPRVNQLIQLCKDYKITHMFALKRPFPSWVQSVYFQYLNEGGTLSLKTWVDRNFSGLMEWRRIFSLLHERANSRGIIFKVFCCAEMRSNPSVALSSIADFIGSELPQEVALERDANVSRKGNVTINTYRGLNFVWPRRPLTIVSRYFVNLPRFLIQGRRGVGGGA